MLSLRTMLDKEQAKALKGSIGVVTGGEQFVARLEGGTLPVERGEAAGAQAVFRASTPMELAALVYGKVPPGEWEREPGRAIEGDRVLARRFLDLFRLPEKVG
jgi:hypothetical protein